MTELVSEQYVRDGCSVVRLTGLLAASSYGRLRDELVKQAVREPSALIVAIGELEFGAEPDLTVFSSVWMQVCDWPGVPIMLVAEAPERRRVVEASGVARFVPLYPSVAAAIGAVGRPPKRSRAEFVLPPDPHSARAARSHCERICRRWGFTGRADDAAIVVTELVENVVRHAGTELRLRFELRDARTLTVAVRDGSERPAVLREAPPDGRRGHGLRMISGLAKAWGCVPDPYDGKVVWAALAE